MSCSKKYEYGYYESQIVAQVVLAGRDEALIDGAREFTDWESLRAHVMTVMTAVA